MILSRNGTEHDVMVYLDLGRDDEFHPEVRLPDGTVLSYSTIGEFMEEWDLPKGDYNER